MPVLVGTHVITCEDCGELVNQSDYILHAKKHGKKRYGLESFEQNSRYFIKFFLLDNSQNLNKWGVTKEALDRRISTFLGKPFIRRKDFSHTPARDGDELLKNQENDKVGTIIDVGIDESSGKAFGIAEIDEETYRIVQSGVMFVSPAIVFNDHDIIQENDREIVTDFIGAHVALVKDPAFGIVKAQIKGQCSGHPSECLPHLKMVQAIRVGSVTHYAYAAKDDDLRSECIKHFIDDGRSQDQAIAICINDPHAHEASRESSLDNKDSKQIKMDCNDKFLQYLKSNAYKTGAEFPWDECIAKMEADGHSEESAAKICAAIKNRTVEHGMKKGIFKDEKDAIEKIAEKIKTDPLYAYLLQSSLSANKSKKKAVMSEDTINFEEKFKELTKQFEDYKKESDKKTTDLQNQAIASERKPIVDRIVKAKLDLGKIKAEDSGKESEKLLKLETETLSEMASEYDGLVTAKNETRAVKMPRFVQATSDNKDRYADDMMIEMGGK